LCFFQYIPTSNVEITKDDNDEPEPEEEVEKIKPKSKTPLDTKPNKKVVIEVDPNSSGCYIERREKREREGWNIRKDKE